MGSIIFGHAKNFEGDAYDVLYVLNDYAKYEIYKKHKVNADFAHIRNCRIKHKTTYTEVLENTIYALYKNDEHGKPCLVRIDGKKFRKTKAPSFQTFEGMNE